MSCLEISLIGSACGKNKYEPRDKTIFLLLCRENPSFYRKKLIENGNIRQLVKKPFDKEIKEVYSRYSKEITDPNSFIEIENDIVNDILKENPDIEKEDIDRARSTISNSMKKDCGKNMEDSIIEKKKYKKGNNRLLIYKDTNHNWELKGFHDATDGDMVVEIKTRMKETNVRKNDYDLYQLFGYMLVMQKEKGMITQSYNKKIYNSTVENEKEYGIIDISEEKWNERYINFYKELNNFFKDFKTYSENKNFDITKVMKPNEIYAEYDSNGRFYNIKPDFANIFKCL